MPVSVRLTNRESGEVAKIIDIDREIREFRGRTEGPSDGIFEEIEYDNMAMTAIGITMRYGGFEVEKSNLEKYIVEVAADGIEFRDPNVEREFLIKRYKVECWR